jgi:hypothetical protein
VKVLDFGLAKAVWGIEESQAPTQLATATFSGTLAGHIVGTPGFMSPEQACGREVDQRTDIWAYGCLLYEMLSGKQAFKGEALADTTAAVLQKEPDWQALPAKTPSKIRELLRQSLQKDVNHRLQRIAGARRVIEEVVGPAKRVKRWQWMAAGKGLLCMRRCRERFDQFRIGGMSISFWACTFLLCSSELKWQQGTKNRVIVEVDAGLGWCGGTYPVAPPNVH